MSILPGVPSISSILGNPASTSTSATSPLVLPWTTSTFKPTAFFPPIKFIDPDRWNALYPYRFLVMDCSKSPPTVVGPNQGNAGSGQGVKTTVNKQSNVDYTISFEPLNSQWVFQLPITPEQLNITDQFAITTTATLRGIIEEHNGVRFKNISAVGSFGVWPSRDNIVEPPGSPSILQSLLGNTLTAATNALSSVQRLINTVTTGTPSSKPKTHGPTANTSDPTSYQGTFGPQSTGYYQALFLQQFLEQYAEAKKRPENAGWRLIFDIPKQNQSFVVTPLSYTWKQDVNKPMNFNYNLQLKAWRRIDIKENVAPVPTAVPTVSPGILQTILNSITAARQTLSSLTGLIGAVESDIEAPLEALRQTSLFIKDLGGVVITAADLPLALQQAFQSAIVDAINNLQTLNGLPANISSNPTVSQYFKIMSGVIEQNEGLTLDNVANGYIGNSAVSAQAASPMTFIFNNLNMFYLLIDQANLSNMTLNTTQQAKVDLTLENVRTLTVADFKNFRSDIETLAINLSNNFGTGAALYNQIYNLPPPATRITPLSLDNYAILGSLYAVMQAYDLLTASTQIDDNQIQSGMQYVAGLASTSGIEFAIPNSKYLAPVPFGLTIEGIAQRYMGDAQAWLEIATLNNLRDPYIDENGFQYSLLSNADGRQIIIASDQNLYLGQPITLYSSTQSPVSRNILDIEELTSSSFLITLDGLPNLDIFLVEDQAYLQAYLPGTVNSQQKIYIPSNISVSDTPTVIVPAIASVDPLTGMSGVDILLASTGDLAINNFGDFRLSYGMTNIVQALNIKMGTQAGTVLLHPEFGLSVAPGASAADTDVTQIYSSINTMIQQDPRFSGINSLNVSLSGPTLSINMAVQLANQSGIFPIAYQVTNLS